MRQREALLLALGLVLASAPAFALPTPPAGPFVPHAPITILGNADFTAANGVVAGSGAPGDPFIISGWSFLSGGTALRIHNVTAAFVVRDNAFDAKIGVHISASAGVGVVQNNQFVVRTTGVLMQSADAHIVDNSFIGPTGGGATGRGVELFTSNSRVESNAFLYVQYGVRADRGSPSILCNDIHDDVVVAGVYVTLTTNATIACNVMTQCTLGIKAESAIGTLIVNNTVTACYGGIEVMLNKDVTIANNTIRSSLRAQVTMDITSGNVTGNVILDGRADAMVVSRSPVLVANNTIGAHLGAGIVVSGAAPELHGNVVAYTSVGIDLRGGSTAHLSANVMTNNTFGLSIPYESRQAIVNMSANVVNGVNVDGSLNASQRVYFYKASNVTIAGQVRDGGFSAGYFGSVTAQGAIVLYEVNTANVNASVVAHHSVGLTAVNSFNVNVDGSLFFNNHVGIRAETVTTAGPVPNCAIAVKDTNVTIPQDPVATIGIDVRSCVAIVGRVNVSVVDIGVRTDANAQLTLFGSTIVNTRIGLDAQGKPDGTNVTANVLAANRVGARFSGATGIVANNTFQGNVEAGVRLENGAALDFRGNNVSENGAGVLDMEVCAGPHTCSSLDAEGNVLFANDGDGVHLNGPSSWRGDVALANGGDGFDLAGSATMRDVRAEANEGDGARILGAFDVEDSLFHDNEADGLDLVGGGDIRSSDFTDNDEAGLRLTPTYVWALHLNVSRNLDGIVLEGPGTSLTSARLPPLSLPGLLPTVWGGGGIGAGAIALDIHRSALEQNERDAIRAGYAIVNATHNWFGRAQGPSVNVADEIGAFQNGVSPLVRFVPYYSDPSMTTTGPLPFL